MIKTKLGTRLLSVLMALTMLLGLVPMTALAEEVDTPTGSGYSKSYTSTDFSGKYISSLKYTVNTTDDNGAKLEDGSGEISMIEGAGEWVDQVWTRTERCKEWTKIIGLLQDAGVNVDSRMTMVFDLSLKDSSGDAISLDGSKTTYTVEAGWAGVCNYKVYIYDGSKLYEETDGTHENDDWSDVLAGYHMGSDEFTVPAGCKVVYVSEFTPAEALAPGAYTVDADLTVLGKNNQVLNGIQVYLSNPELPPTKPMKQKGYLVVHEDGTMTLSLDGFNHIFSQQTITSGKDVTVDELRYFNMREYYVDMAESEEDKALYETIPEKCIDGITVTLNNYNGFYSFGECTQYPVILFKYTDMCLDLTVDFSSAVKAYERPGEGETAYTRTFTDESTGVSVFVETTEEWGQKLADANMSISYLDESDSRYEDAKFQMDRLFVRDCYKLLAFKLTDSEGNELSLEGNCQATVSGADVSGWTNPVVYQLKGDISRTKSISADISDSKASFVVRDLDTVALIGKYSLADKGITEEALPFVWLRSEAADNSYSLTQYMIAANAQVDSEYGQTVSNAYLDCKVTSTMRKESSEQGDRYYAQLANPDDSSSFNNTFEGISKVEVQLPYDAAKPYYYIVLTDGTSTYVKQYTNTAKHDGSVYFDIINSFGQGNTKISFDDGTYSKDWGNVLLDALARGWNGAVPSSAKPTAYILNSDKLYAGQPIAYGSQSSTYSGKEQTETTHMYNDSVVLSGDRTATDAGTYTVSATPAEGRTWLDGSTEPFSYKWTISQKSLTVKYTGETIHEGETPELKVTYTGWASGESEENAKGFEPASITAPETLSVGSYTLTPKGGSADNYVFNTYKGGTLNVVSADTKIIDKPTAVPETLFADGEEKTGVLEGEGYTLTGDYKATVGGKSYTAVATLKEGYAWSDGDTSSSCKVTWSLWKYIEKPVFEKTVFEYTGETIKLDAEGKYTFSNGYSTNGTQVAKVAGDYTVTYTPYAPYKCMWTDGTNDPVVINWSIVNPAADYTAVDAAIAKIPADLSGYTDESVKALTDAKNAVVRDLSSDKQSEVDAMAKAIEDAVAGLVKKDSGDSSVTVVSTSVVTANLFVPGELNKQLPGVTAYMTNGNNPLGEGGYEKKAPTEPVSNNAVLTKYSDNTVTVTVPIPNPVFTLQKIDGGTNAKILSAPRDSQTYSSADGSVSRNGRITSITVQLKDNSGTYVFSDCTEFPTILGVDWNVPLTLSVEFPSDKPATKDADYTAVDAAIAKIPADLSGYTDDSVKALNDAKNAVVRGLSSDKQSEVDAMAKAIEDAIAALVKKADPEPTPDVKKFSDVPADSYCAKAVDWAVENGVTMGTTDTTFSPNAVCTRAQAVTLLWRAAGSPEPTLTKNPFTDVSSSSFCYKAVLWAYENGITAGTTATTFAPNATVTRAQAVTFMYRAAGSPKVSGSSVFTDVDSGSFCYDAVLWAAENGITAGTTATTFAPNAGCTRGQIVTFLYRQTAK